MFPSQPQIGQDMANERRQQATHIRQATEARSARTPRRPRQSRRIAARPTLRRRLVVLFARLVSPEAE